MPPRPRRPPRPACHSSGPLFLVLLSLLASTAQAAFVPATSSQPPTSLLRRRATTSPDPAATTSPVPAVPRPPKPNPLSFLIRTKPSPSPAAKPLRIHPMERSDIAAVVRLAAREWTPLDALPEYGGAPSGTLQEQIDAWWLRQNVYFGMLARFAYPDKQDHQVFLLEDLNQAKDNTLVGMVELSQQPITGLPPPLLPLLPVVKQLFASLGFPVQPYVSNLLIDAAARRQGHAARLMAHAEACVKEHGGNVVYLHADYNYGPANRLYEALGYECVLEYPQAVERIGMTRLKWYRKTLLE